MTEIYTETFGTGTAILMVHGWAMHSGILRSFAKELAKSYQVTLIDLPGHGRSAPIYPFTLETISKALAKAIPYKSCCWLGWSLGAEIVLEICRQFPGRVNKLILLAGTPCFVRHEDWPGMDERILDKFAENLQQDSQETLMRFLSLQVKGSSEQQTSLRDLKATVFESQAPDPQTLQEGLEILKTADLRAEFAKLDMPVAVVLGELDTMVPVVAGEQMRALLPAIELSVISRAGHVPFLSHPKAVLNVVSHFMDKERCS